MATEIISKTCTRCKTKKPLSEFYKDPSHKDGHQSICKCCIKIYIANYQRTDRGCRLHREAMKRYHQTTKGRLLKRMRCMEYQRRLRKTAAYKKHRRFIYWQNPDFFRLRNSAQCAVYYAIRTGKLPSLTKCKCKKCGAPAQHYHHWSYARKHRLDVIPVCIPCHKGIHRQILISAAV